MPVHGVEAAWFVLDLSARALVAAGAIALLLRLLRVQAAAVRHAAWTVVLAAMLLMPLLPSIVPALPLPSTEALSLAPRTNAGRIEVPTVMTVTPAAAAADQTTAPAVAVEAAAPLATTVAARTAPTSTNWVPAMAAGVYVIGLFFFLGRLLLGSRLVQGMVRRSKRADLPGVVHESHEVAVPLSAGAIRPVIILPAAWKMWPEDTLAAVMAHEMAHVRRRDPLVACLARLNRAIFWFHPLAWWLERQLAITAEHACDEAAASVVPERRRYAEILIEMADLVRRNRGRVAWQAVGVNGAGLLNERIDRVLRDATPRVSRARGLAVLTASVSVILLVVACRQQVPAQPLREDPELAKQLVDQDRRTKEFEAARDMTQEQADVLEKRIDANPQDFDARRQLVWYYSQSSLVSWDKKVPGLRRHALWLIEHHPEHEVRAPSLSPQYDPEGFVAAKKLWERHLSRPDASPLLIYRAANFFAPSDKPYAEQLIMRGMRLDPESTALRSHLPANIGGYQWESQLAQLYAAALRASEGVTGTYNDLRTRTEFMNSSYALGVRSKLAGSKDARLLARVGSLMIYPVGGETLSRDERRRLTEQMRSEGITYLRRALEIDPNLELAKAGLYRAGAVQGMADGDRSPGSPPAVARMANSAHEGYMMSEDITEFAQKDPETARHRRVEAKQQAEQVLQFATGHPGDSRYSSSVMTAHHVLSAIALRDGDRRRAVHHLLESVKVPPSDGLRYAPPFSWLRPVNRLLKEGERDGVVEFLEALAPLLGTQERERVLNDAKAIREGRMPTSYQHATYRETTPSPFKPMK